MIFKKYCRSLFYEIVIRMKIVNQFLPRLRARIFFVFAGVFFIITSVSFPAHAQTQYSFRGWAAIFATYRLNSKISLYCDAQLRSSAEWKEVQTFIFRPGIHFHVNNNMIATVGYAYIGHHRTVDSVSGWGPEHRIWEQFIINQTFNISGHPTTLQHRLRLEQRFISRSVVNDDKLVTDGYNFSQRLRYFARAVFPLQKTTSFARGAFISLQDEIFVNVENSPSTNGKFFDQNRFYTSIGYRTSRKFDIEIGYMNQFIEGKTSNSVNNILQAAGYLRL